MSYAVYLEQMEDRWIAHASALLGCFAEEDSWAAALAAAPAAIVAHSDRLRRHGQSLPALAEPPKVHVEETIREWIDPLDPANSVNAFFACDAPPLTADEVALAGRLLAENRDAQRAAIQGLSAAELAQSVEAGWSIERILVHIGRAEWWYLDRLGLAPVGPKPNDWLLLQEMGRQQMLAVLPQLAGVGQIVLADHEVWSPRKMVRRALWHEQEHTQHLLRFRQLLMTA